MIFKALSSEKGFGLIYVLAALFIVTISIAGIFIASITARAKAVENYHYRSALLVAAGKMDLIKYYNRDIGDNYPNINNVPGLFNEIIIDEYNNRNVTVQVESPYPFIETISDLQVAPYVMYSRVKLRVKWTEPGMMFKPRTTKRITLYEDYFRRINQR